MTNKLLITSLILLVIILGGIFYISQHKEEINPANLPHAQINAPGGAMGTSGASIDIECNISGQVTNITYSKAWNDSCLTTGMCPSDFYPYHPALYTIEVWVKDVKETILRENEKTTCNRIYPKDMINSFYTGIESNIPKIGDTINIHRDRPIAGLTNNIGNEDYSIIN